MMKCGNILSLFYWIVLISMHHVVATVVSKRSHRPTPWLTPTLSSAIKQKSKLSKELILLQNINDADTNLNKK